MGEAFEVALLVGSLRKDSWSRETTRALIDLQPASLRSTIAVMLRRRHA
jgi:hypothetical protein